MDKLSNCIHILQKVSKSLFLGNLYKAVHIRDINIHQPDFSSSGRVALWLLAESIFSLPSFVHWPSTHRTSLVGSNRSFQRLICSVEIFWSWVFLRKRRKHGRCSTSPIIKRVRRGIIRWMVLGRLAWWAWTAGLHETSCIWFSNSTQLQISKVRAA